MSKISCKIVLKNRKKIGTGLTGETGKLHPLFTPIFRDHTFSVRYSMLAFILRVFFRWAEIMDIEIQFARKLVPNFGLFELCKICRDLVFRAFLGG